VAKFFYPITPNYVSDWGVPQALREIIANGIDAEVEHGAKFSVRHQGDKLIVTNENITVPISALYFGESSKRNTDMIGQYGEGLKLALLVFARKGIKLQVRNGANETWKPSIDIDKHGQRCLVVDIQTANRQSNDFEVTIPGVDDDAWATIRSWFIRLHPPAHYSTQHTELGDLIDDPEFVGKIFVKGVYVTSRPKYQYGYNFTDIDIGRDRQIPASWQIDEAISKIWNEVSKRKDASFDQFRLFEALATESAEQEAFSYMKPKDLVGSLAATFRSKYGEKAVPVKGTTEGMELEHLGHKPVPLPMRLVDLLREELPSPEAIQRDLSTKIVERFPFGALSESEQQTLVRAMRALEPDAPKLSERVAVVRYGAETTQGTHLGHEIGLARHVLKDFGKTFMVLAHEIAHDKGGDGEYAHVDSMHHLCERAINRLLGLEVPAPEQAPKKE
jgi:hypothetical protein